MGTIVTGIEQKETKVVTQLQLFQWAITIFPRHWRKTYPHVM